MTTGNRHFATFTQNSEEVIVLGYRQKTNDVLVCFPSALSQSEGQDLRRIVQAESAQKKDYLMDQVGGSVLGAAHHPSGSDWQSHLLRQAAEGRGRAVRKVTMKELEFHDSSQKAFFAGYGPSIEPEVDALRKQRVHAQDAMLNGAPLPEPSQQPQTQLQAPVEEPAPAAPDQNDALAEALNSIAAGQKAILDQLSEMNKPATSTRKRATPRKKPATRKPAGKKAGDKAEVSPETAASEETASDEDMSSD